MSLSRKKATEQLRSLDLSERVLAAQFFQRFARASDLPMLTSAFEHEKSPWVSSLLQAALSSLGGTQEGADQNPPSDDPILNRDVNRRDAESAVVEQISKILMHELSPIIGRLEVKADAEIQGYQESRTAAEVAKLKKFIVLMKSLATAARVASADAIELESFLRETIMDASGGTLDAFTAFSGPRPMNVIADRYLLHVIVTNAFKNSKEAFEVRGRRDDDIIVITWGSDKLRNWIAVTDNGNGFSKKQMESTGPGFTTKKDHFGFGLFIMDQAARSIDGRIERSNGNSGGAIVRFSWPKER